MKRILAIGLAILVTACGDDDDSSSSKESINGIYTNGKVGVLIDTTLPDLEAFFIEYNLNNQHIEIYQDVSGDVDNIVIQGEYRCSPCDLDRELIGNLSSGELLLTDNTTGLTKSYIKQPNSADISAIVGIHMEDGLGGMLEVAADHSFTAGTPLCSTINGTIYESRYYYQLEATASGCFPERYNGDYTGIGFSAEIEKQLTVFVYMSNDSSSLYGSFHE